ncbi:MAG: PilZ domain-containing protein [Nitrospiraceae bacterium]
MNLRQAPRIPVDLQVWYTTPEHEVQRGTMYDLSPGGCAVATIGAVQAGSRLALTILAPGQEIPLTLESVAVRWTALGEFGVEFDGMNAADRDRLGHVLTRASQRLDTLGSSDTSSQIG